MGAYIFISVLIIVICVLLILIVLVQNSKGGGLASNFSSSNQIMGVRKTTDFLEKATWSLAIALLALSLISVFVIPKNKVTTKTSEVSTTESTSAPAPMQQQQPPQQQQQGK